MRARVVFESMFGNTRAVAEAVARGLGSAMTVELAEVSAAPPDAHDVDLLVVGGPTHAFGMSRPTTRADAAGRSTTPLVSQGIGMREWLSALVGSPEVAAAAFDTRIDHPRVPGSAARAAAKRLRQRGFRLLGRPASFYVGDTAGPLLPGELERAQRWGEELAADLGVGAAPTAST